MFLVNKFFPSYPLKFILKSQAYLVITYSFDKSLFTNENANLIYYLLNFYFFRYREVFTDYPQQLLLWDFLQ
jgi:hypothetical protein